MTRSEPDPADPSDLDDLDGPWRRRVDVGWRTTPIGLVLLPAGRADPVTVAGSAVAVWELLAEPISRAELSRHLAARYEVDPATVDGDLDGLLRQLAALPAIEVA